MSLNLEDFNEIDKFLKQHFENITPEEFKRNLKDACPDLLDNSNQLTHDNKTTIHSMKDPLLSNDNNTDYQEIDRILKEHFKKVTPEEFRHNLAIACPDLLEGSKSASGNQNHVTVSDKEKVWEIASPHVLNSAKIESIEVSRSLSEQELLTPKSNWKYYVFGALIAAVMLGTIFINLKPKPALNVDFASAEEPIEVGESLVYEYLQVSDKSGKKASINVVLLSSKYRWQIKQDRILQDSNDEKKSIAIDKLSENLQRDGVYEVVKSNKGVSRIISIGAASCEGSTQNEENRAEKRALATNKFVVQKMFAVGHYSFINLGKFEKDDCKKLSPEKTSWQRALIILGVSQEEEDINITEAVRARLTKIPIDLEDYSLGKNEKFQVKDVKSE
jgi:hypothetical protein